MSTALRLVTIAGVTLCAGAVLTGCSLLGPAAPDRDEGTGEIVGAGEADVFQIRVGDCLAPANLDTTLETVPTVPCGEPHVSEVYAGFQLDDGDYPGAEQIAVEAESLCLGAFEGFIGVAYEDSVLYANTMTPTKESWTDLDDREILCIVTSDGPSVTGTLRAAAR